jgi:hypothetical protein
MRISGRLLSPCSWPSSWDLWRSGVGFFFGGGVDTGACRPGRLGDRADDRRRQRRHRLSRTRPPSSVSRLLRRRRASAGPIHLDARHRAGKRTRARERRAGSGGQARASRIRGIGAADRRRPELEATTTVDQSRFGMSDRPFRNVRRPTKVRVKTRLVRSDSRFYASRQEGSTSCTPLRARSR